MSGSIASGSSLIKGRGIIGYDSTNSVYRYVGVDASGTLASNATLSAVNDAGENVSLAATEEGHLEVAVHSPISAFGDVLTATLHPVAQVNSVYGINSQQILTSSATGGSVTYANDLFTLQTGTSVGGYGVLQTRKRIPYQIGQGMLARFSTAFTTGVALSSQVAGFGTSESGLYFGYQNATFGTFYVNGGVRAVVTATVTVASSHSENVTVKLNNVNYTIAVTNSGNIQRTVWELAQGDYSPAWTVSPSGATLIFVQGAAGAITIGNFSLTATSAAATWASTVTGVTATTTFAAQSAWNGDKLDGTGASGVTLDPTKLNNYAISVAQTGTSSYFVSVLPSTANNSSYIRVHSVTPTTLTPSALRQPNGPITMSAISQGSTTNLTVTSASLSGFIEGLNLHTGNRYSWGVNLAATVTTAIRPLFIIHNTRYFKSKANQKVISVVSINGAVKHTQPVTVYLIRSIPPSTITLTGNPNFSSFHADSAIWKDQSATAVTVGSSSQYVFIQNLAETSSFDFQFRNEEAVTLQPGEYLAVCAITDSGTANNVNLAVTWRED